MSFQSIARDGCVFFSRRREHGRRGGDTGEHAVLLGHELCGACGARRDREPRREIARGGVLRQGCAGELVEVVEHVVSFFASYRGSPDAP